MSFREAIERDVEDLRGLVGRIVRRTGETSVARDLLTGLQATADPCEQERLLDKAALELRRRWLRLAHRPADVTLKSPRQGVVAAVPCGATVAFGYERDLDATLLETRGPAYMQMPAGWSGDLVLWRSGQAALAGLLHWLVARHGRDAALGVGHAGAYFETAALLETFPERVLQRVAPDQPADVVIAEPVWCDGQFGIAGRLPAARHVLCLDTTLAGPAYDPGPCLAAQGDCRLAFVVSSGLKLDQAGLELANVGLVRVLSRDGDAAARTVGGELRRLRGLVGGALTFDEMSALSAPWFMDRAYADRYVGAVFAHNRALADAVGRNSPVFRDGCHPSLADAGSAAPFCALELRQATPQNDRRLLAIVQAEIERRGLLAAPGGSFGFRGHRFELIEPEPGRGRRFLRVALGWRDGHSRAGLCALFAELAAAPSFAALEARYGR